MTRVELERHRQKREVASAMLLWAAVGGFVGARGWSICTDWQSFIQNPMRMLFTGFGFVFYGALIGGFIAVGWSIRQYQLRWRMTLDCIAPGLVLAQALGRIGCELAGDGDWGQPSELPWAHAYPNAIIGWHDWTAASGCPMNVRVHPTPLYEAIAYLTVFAILWSLRKHIVTPGHLFAIYLVLAPAARFAIEFIRINPAMLWKFTEAQLVSVVLVSIGLCSLMMVSPHFRLSNRS